MAPHDTLRPNLCSASLAMPIRRSLVSSRNRRILPSAAAARSASEAPSAISGSGSGPTTVISSRSMSISGGPVNQPPGTLPVNQPRSLSRGVLS
jgi:hypothetical protein